MTNTIVLIHGAWLNSHSWAKVKARYEARGFRVIAPDWPFDDRSPEQLRSNPAPELAKLGQREIVAHYERVIRNLPEKPILIGHSLGLVCRLVCRPSFQLFRCSATCFHGASPR